MNRSLLEDSDFLRELGDVIDDRMSETLEDYLAEGRLTSPGQSRTARLAVAVALLSAAVLLPWSLVLLLTRPHTGVSQHWTLTWVGLDVAIAVGLALTAMFVGSDDPRAAIASMGTATLLASHAWFDVCTAVSGAEQRVAVAEALLLELPLATAGLWLALRRGRPRL